MLFQANSTRKCGGEQVWSYKDTEGGKETGCGWRKRWVQPESGEITPGAISSRSFHCLRASMSRIAFSVPSPIKGVRGQMKETLGRPQGWNGRPVSLMVWAPYKATLGQWYRNAFGRSQTTTLTAGDNPELDWSCQRCHASILNGQGTKDIIIGWRPCWNCGNYSLRHSHHTNWELIHNIA